MKLYLHYLIVIFMVLLISACGDNDSSSAPQTSKSTQPQNSAPQPKLTKNPQEITKEQSDTKINQLTKLENDIASIRKSKRLVIVTITAPRIYYKWRGKWVGLEHDLLRAYANSIGVETKFIPVCCVKEALKIIKEGQAHIAAARLTRTPERDKILTSSSQYYQTKQQLVCHKDMKRIKSIKDLTKLEKNRFAVIGKSSYIEQLLELKKTHTDLQWTEFNQALTEDLLKKVWQKKLDCIVADANIVSVYRRYYPELRVPFSLSKDQSVVWYLPHSAKKLHYSINKWFATEKTQYAIKVLYNRYYGYLGKFDYLDSRIFLNRMQERLPKFRPMFQLAGKKYDLDWRLIAAMGYQESHWDPKARSPTGVRGLMMLTRATAKRLKVKNRLDPQQSIDGGSKYFRMMLKHLPNEVTGRDRYLLALASYNLGLGHVLDAMKLAKREGLMPNKWASIKEVLPKLHQRKYYSKLRYGKARGREAMQYIRNIRNYYDLLVKKITSIDDIK